MLSRVRFAPISHTRRSFFTSRVRFAPISHTGLRNPEDDGTNLVYWSNQTTGEGGGVFFGEDTGPEEARHRAGLGCIVLAVEDNAVGFGT